METAPATQPKWWLNIWTIYLGLDILLIGLAIGVACTYQTPPDDTVGGNWHPFWSSRSSTLYDLCMRALYFLLAPISLLTGIGLGLYRGSWKPLLIGIGVAVLQVFLVYALLSFAYMLFG